MVAKSFLLLKELFLWLDITVLWVVLKIVIDKNCLANNVPSKRVNLLNFLIKKEKKHIFTYDNKHDCTIMLIQLHIFLKQTVVNDYIHIIIIYTMVFK